MITIKIGVAGDFGQVSTRNGIFTHIRANDTTDRDQLCQEVKLIFH